MPSGGRIIDVQSAIARGDLSAAKRLLNELHIEAPENSEHAQLHCDYADCLERSGDLTTAAAHYRHALELRPDDVDATLRLGLVLAQVGAQQEALTMLKRAVGLAPNSFRAWRAYGMQLWSAGQRDLAADAIANALAISPDSPELTRAAAELETERGRPSVALFKRARLLNPKNLDLILGEAVSLCERGNAADAIESLKRATAAHPSWIKGHGALAQLRWQGGEREHFAESFRRALEREPANLDLLKGYFSTLMRAGHYATVLAALPGARVHIEASALFDRYEAICAGESNDVARAEAAFARQLNSRDWDLHVAHVRHFLRTGRIEEAARLGEQIADERPSTAAWAYLSLAWRLLKDPRSSWLEGAGRFVKIYDPPEIRSSLGTLAEVLRRLHAVSQHSFDQSPRGGTQSDGDLFSRALPEIEAMSKHVQATIDAYIAELPPMDVRHPFLKLRHSTTQRAASYSIWLRSGGFHVNHMHPRAWISCSFYVDVPPSIGEDTADPSGWFVIGQAPRELRLDLPATALIQPRPGRLVVFPSMMWHGSLPFESGERLAVVADYAAAPL